MYNGKALERDKQVDREFWDDGDGRHRHNCFSTGMCHFNGVFKLVTCN